MNSKNIKNYKNLREDALIVIGSIINSINPENLIKESIKPKIKQFMEKFEKIYIFGAGKACAPMARALEDILGNRLIDGILVVPDGYKLPTKIVTIYEASHPIPDMRGYQAATKIYESIKKINKDNLIIFLFSGGGSALLPLPYPPVTLKDLQDITISLLNSGATINEINVIRKHLSLLQGGRMAYLLCCPSITFLLSDVVGNDPSIIASGPTIPDTSTYKQADFILKKYKIYEQVSTRVKDFIAKGINKTIEETPKSLRPIHRHFLIGSNDIALSQGQITAKNLKYKSIIISNELEGEAKIVGKNLAKIGKKFLNTSNGQPTCLIFGGETTVSVKGHGKGGRNQELVLGAALELTKTDNILIASFSTDGKDGPTDAAGAFIDSKIIQKSLDLGLNPYNYLNNNNSYNFFLRSGGLIKTNYTFTNVGDIMLILIGG